MVTVVVFRSDASLEIGTGHVMRCLTLAEALIGQGAECHFICREHPGHLIEAIEERGITVHRLPIRKAISSYSAELEASGLAHELWLGDSWQQDAAASRALIKRLGPDWLVVDHYALDARWEDAVLPQDCKAPATRLMVIDDLADRHHRADLLLDQNLGRETDDYVALVPGHCRILAGPHYALLRLEFSMIREWSLERRRNAPLKRLLISMGGVDKDNATGQVLKALKDCDLPSDVEISVVMGATAPWREDVRRLASELPWDTEVAVNVSDMAQRMAEADLAIGAAGSTSWERCCLGLPTLMLVLAENQRPIAQSLHQAGAAKILGSIESCTWKSQLREHIAKMVIESDYRLAFSCNAANVTSGMGASVLIELIMKGMK